MTSETANQMTEEPPAARKRRGRRGRPGIFLIVCTFIYALMLAMVSVSNLVGPERTSLGSLNLYLPQWPWALPCVVLLPWYLTSAWRWTWVPLLMLAWVFGPIAGFCFHLPVLATPAGGTKLRVMTYNVKWGNRNAAAVLANIAEAHPDLILMQDSAGVLDTTLKPLRSQGWNIEVLDQYTVLSRFKLEQPEARWITPDHSHESLRCVLRIGKRAVTLYDVHFVTPRWALGAVQENGPDAAFSLEQNVTLRQLQATILALHVISEKDPVILTGDLNVPVHSRACQTLFRAGLRDAFSAGGWGYGFTYGQSTPLEQPFMRIDHILVSPHWTVLSSHVGSPVGSDHSPVIADLLLPDTN